MAKSGLSKDIVKQNGVKQRTDCTLTKEIAVTMFEIIKQGGKLFTTQQWKDNSPITITVGENSTEVRPATYQKWIHRENIIPEINKTLRQFIAEAKEQRAIKRHEQQRQEILRKAQEGLNALQALPIGTKSKLVRKKYRASKGGELYQTGLETEEVERDIDPQMVSIKQKGDHFVLERLDPAFSSKSENKNLNVTISLSDLRKAKEAADAKKHADHEQ